MATTATIPGVTTTAANTLLVHAVGTRTSQSPSPSTPSGDTADISNAVGVFHQTAATSGAQSAVTSSIGTSTSIHYGAITLALNPPAGPSLISGTTSLTFGASGTLTGAGQLAGSTSLATAVSGTLQAVAIVAGTTSLGFGLTGALAGAGALTGGAALAFAVTGAITNRDGIAGSTSITFGASGALAGTGALAGSTSLDFALSLQPGAIVAISGTTSVSFSLTGSMEATKPFVNPAAPMSPAAFLSVRTLPLDPAAWDVVLDPAGNWSLTDADASIAQDVASAIRTFLGECWYDTSLGLPYFESILGKRPPASLVAAKIQQAALGIAQVSSATVVRLALKNRQLTGTVLVTSTFNSTPIAVTF